MMEDFWAAVDDLVARSPVVVDRPRGSRHPRYGESTYPLDYGYLEGTTAADSSGIDVWRGTLPEGRATGAILTIDGLKRDAEVKLLLGCTPAEAEMALAYHQDGEQAAILVLRD